MVAVTVVIAIVVSLGTLAWVVWPLINKAPAPMLVEDDRLAELLGRKDAVLAAIRDLEFDYSVGKLDADDYQLYDGRLRRQAVALIQQIEQIAPASTEMDATLEHEVRRRRKVVEGELASVPPALSAPALPAMQPVVARAPLAPGAAGTGNGALAAPALAGRRFCTSCGHPLESHHRFCANCGSAVAAVAVSAAPAAPDAPASVIEGAAE